MRFLLLLFAAGFITCSQHAAAAWPAAQRLDAYLDALAKHELANGSLAISEKGQPRYQRAFGYAVIAPGRNEAADTGTRYRIGAVSQLFTAALVMLVAEGG